MLRNKIRACEEVGIRSEHHALPESTSAIELLELIASLNSREDVDGISGAVALATANRRSLYYRGSKSLEDVDGFNPVNVGMLAMGRPVFVPCTPAGIIELLDHHKIEMRGVNACVVGRSQIVGRRWPNFFCREMRQLRSVTPGRAIFAAVTREADILVVAIGRAGLIGHDHIKPGATVIDVGIIN